MHLENAYKKCSIDTEKYIEPHSLDNCVMCFVLFTGESFRSLSYQFRVGVSTIRQFIPETCSAIYKVLKDKYHFMNPVADMKEANMCS